MSTSNDQDWTRSSMKICRPMLELTFSFIVSAEMCAPELKYNEFSLFLRLEVNLVTF